jgi:hemoglobin
LFPAVASESQVLASAVLEEQQVYEVIGEEGFQRLVSAFYRQVPNDDVLGPMYPAEDLHNAEKRLRDFLIFRFGGPARYLEDRGHPRLRMRHAPFAVTGKAREHWMAMMGNALETADLPPEVVSVLKSYFESTATAMVNRLA